MFLKIKKNIQNTKKMQILLIEFLQNNHGVDQILDYLDGFG